MYLSIYLSLSLFLSPSCIFHSPVRMDAFSWRISEWNPLLQPQTPTFSNQAGPVTPPNFFAKQHCPSCWNSNPTPGWDWDVITFGKVFKGRFLLKFLWKKYLRKKTTSKRWRPTRINLKKTVRCLHKEHLQIDANPFDDLAKIPYICLNQIRSFCQSQNWWRIRTPSTRWFFHFIASSTHPSHRSCSCKHRGSCSVM